MVNDISFAAALGNPSKSSTLAPYTQINNLEFRDKFAIGEFLLSIEGARHYINEQVTREKDIFGNEWKARRTEVIEDITDPLVRGRIKGKVSGLKSMVFVKLAGLLTSTGQIGCVDLTGEIEASQEFGGLPVVYIDSLYCNTPDKCAQKHEIDEMLQWENLRANVLKIDAKKEMRAWIRNHIESTDDRLNGTECGGMNSRQIAKFFCGYAYPIRGLYKKISDSEKKYADELDYKYIATMLSLYGTDEKSAGVNIAAGSTLKSHDKPSQGLKSINIVKIEKALEVMETYANWKFYDYDKEEWYYANVLNGEGRKLLAELTRIWHILQKQGVSITAPEEISALIDKVPSVQNPHPELFVDIFPGIHPTSEQIVFSRVQRFERGAFPAYFLIPIGRGCCNRCLFCRLESPEHMCYMPFPIVVKTLQRYANVPRDSRLLFYHDNDPMHYRDEAIGADFADVYGAMKAQGTSLSCEILTTGWSPKDKVAQRAAKRLAKLFNPSVFISFHLFKRDLVDAVGRRDEIKIEAAYRKYKKWYKNVIKTLRNAYVMVRYSRRHQDYDIDRLMSKMWEELKEELQIRDFLLHDGSIVWIPEDGRFEQPRSIFQELNDTTGFAILRPYGGNVDIGYVGDVLTNIRRLVESGAYSKDDILFLLNVMLILQNNDFNDAAILVKKLPVAMQRYLRKKGITANKLQLSGIDDKHMRFLRENYVLMFTEFSYYLRSRKRITPKNLDKILEKFGDVPVLNGVNHRGDDIIEKLWIQNHNQQFKTDRIFYDAPRVKTTISRESAARPASRPDRKNPATASVNLPLGRIVPRHGKDGSEKWTVGDEKSPAIPESETKEVLSRAEKEMGAARQDGVAGKSAGSDGSKAGQRVEDLRKVYGRKDRLMIRTKQDLAAVFDEMKQNPAIRQALAKMAEYYDTGGDEFGGRAERLYEKYERHYLQGTPKGETISLYILMLIKDAVEDRKERITPEGSNISLPEFFALLDVYLDIDSNVIFDKLSGRLSLLNRPSGRGIPFPEHMFKPITGKAHVRDELTPADRKLNLPEITDALRVYIKGQFVDEILHAMDEVKYVDNEKREYLLLLLALKRRQDSQLRKKGFKIDKEDFWKAGDIIRALRGRRLEEAIDLYYAFFLAGDSPFYVFETLCSACNNLDEKMYDRAMQETYRLANLGIDPIPFLKRFITYAGKYFKGEELEKAIELYEDTILTFYKYRDVNPSDPEDNLSIFAKRRDEKGGLVSNKNAGWELDYLVDLVDKEDFIYSLELARKMAGIGGGTAQGRSLLPSLTTIAAKVGRVKYRKTAEFLYNLLFSKNYTFFRRNMPVFMSEVAPELVSRLDPELFIDNVLRIMRLFKSMEEKSMQDDFPAYWSFTMGRCKIYQNQQLFDLLIGLAEDLVRDGRRPGPFLSNAVERCLDCVEGQEDKITLIRFLYTISKKANTKEICSDSSSYVSERITFDDLIFSKGLPAIITEKGPDNKWSELIHGKDLLKVLEMVINWIDQGVSGTIIMDRLKTRIPLAYKGLSMNDPRFNFVVTLEGEDLNVLSGIVRDASLGHDVRAFAAARVTDPETLRAFIYDASLGDDIRQNALNKLAPRADLNTLKAFVYDPALSDGIRYQVLNDLILKIDSWELKTILSDNGLPVSIRVLAIANVKDVQLLRALSEDVSLPNHMRFLALRAIETVFSGRNFSFSQVELGRYLATGLHPPSLSWRSLLGELGLKEDIKPVLIDRKLILDISDDERIVIKLARDGPSSVDDLGKEAAWLAYLAENKDNFVLNSALPKPLMIQGEYIFRLADLPIESTAFSIGVNGANLNKDGYAICLKINRKERYANDAPDVSPREFIEAIGKAGRDLGKLASRGIFHTSLIPAFHNRPQARARSDLGLYQWWQRGRFDRWLESCDFPNMGTDGIRDLEHLEQRRWNYQEFEHAVGTELFSLCLIIGSYFRNRDRSRVGHAMGGNITNAQYLFDRELLKEALTAALSSYHEGLFGRGLSSPAVDLDNLSDRMINCMGVDWHMTEVLRAATQQAMPDQEFQDYLKKSGYSEGEIKKFIRGTADVALTTGPHLGEFGGALSIPELIDMIEIMSGLFSSELMPKLEYAGDVYPVPQEGVLALPEKEVEVYITARFHAQMRFPKAEMWFTENGFDWKSTPMEVVGDWGNAFRFKGRVPPHARTLTFRFYANGLLDPLWRGDMGGKDINIVRTKSDSRAIVVPLLEQIENRGAKIPPDFDHEQNIAADIENTLQALDKFIPEQEKQDEGKYYTVRYNAAKIPQGSLAEELLEVYVEQVMPLRMPDKDRVRLFPSRKEGEGLITVECYKDLDRNQKIGEGHVDIGEDIDGKALRLIGMLNMALLASHIPNNTPPDEMAGYDTLISFIKRQYKELAGEDLPDRVLQDTSKGIRITLPRAEPIPAGKIEEYYRLTIIQLQQAA